MMAILILAIIVLVERSTISDLQSRSDDFTKSQILMDQKNKTIDSLTNLVDSLHDENFGCQVQVGRYEAAYDIFLERDPKGAKAFDYIISHETE